MNENEKKYLDARKARLERQSVYREVNKHRKQMRSDIRKSQTKLGLAAGAVGVGVGALAGGAVTATKLRKLPKAFTDVSAAKAGVAKARSVSKHGKRLAIELGSGLGMSGLMAGSVAGSSIASRNYMDNTFGKKPNGGQYETSVQGIKKAVNDKRQKTAKDLYMDVIEKIATSEKEISKSAVLQLMS